MPIAHLRGATGVAEIEDLALIVARAGFARLAAEPGNPSARRIGDSPSPSLSKAPYWPHDLSRPVAPAPIASRACAVLRPALPRRHRTEIACRSLPSLVRFLVECAAARKSPHVARLRLLCGALRRGGELQLVSPTDGSRKKRTKILGCLLHVQLQRYRFALLFIVQWAVR